MINAYNKGWALIPLHENSKIPNLPKGNSFLTNKPTTEDYGNFKFGNYGIVCGEMSGICVLDLDYPHCIETLNILEFVPDLEETPQVYTPNGRHLYYKWTPDVKTGVAVSGRGLDIRSTGSYVVGPGSRIDGELYVWSDVYGIDTPLKAPPHFMRKQENKTSLDEWYVGAKIGKGKRNNTLASLAGTVVRRGIPYTTLIKILHIINDDMCEPPIKESELMKIAQSAEGYRKDA